MLCSSFLVVLLLLFCHVFFFFLFFSFVLVFSLVFSDVSLAVYILLLSCFFSLFL